MTTLSHLYINTDANELAMHFKLSDWIGPINWTFFRLSDMSSILTGLFVRTP